MWFSQNEVVITKTQIWNSEKLRHSEILESSPDLTWDSGALLIELTSLLWLDTVWTSDINSFLSDKWCFLTVLAKRFQVSDFLNDFPLPLH